MSDDTTVIELLHVTCLRADAALCDVSLTFTERTCTFLVGDEGASLLLRLVSLQERPDVGELIFDTRIVHEYDEEQLAVVRNRCVAQVFSASHLLPGLSAVENVAVRLFKLRSVETAEAAERTHSILDFVGLRGDPAADVLTLSRADQQRVALARALVTGPILLTLHRAEDALEPEEAAEFRRTVQRACTIFGVTAIGLPGSALGLPPAQRVIVVDGGIARERRASVEK